ncbi:BspA family leucine-rich repeat surface protein [Mycoplasma yeatsii]|uniref:BspA family leucine-rich repeat surface protein n=1 Tax=Mycoplasma yeatsii TaxID=51365 RepID=UPI0005B24F94|nr:BspA family leucine-rich repeat surface protein [Mycoplasma yeatsii]AJM71843.1 PARCEL domain-containing lipoprotein [Mycoplasma yeatsii GM274B]
MKKLISILSILTLSSTATFGVVSCKTTQNQDNLETTLKKQLKAIEREIEFNENLLGEIDAEINQNNPSLNNVLLMTSISDLDELDKQISNVKKELKEKEAKLKNIKNEINEKISKAKETFIKYVNKVWDERIGGDVLDSSSHQDVFNIFKEKGKQYAFFEGLNLISDKNEEMSLTVTYKNDINFEQKLKFNKIWPKHQKAEYKTEEEKTTYTKIGYFTNDKGEIQIEEFLYDTIKVPDHLPKFITNLSHAFRNNGNHKIEGLENWDASNVTDMSGMFRNCRNFNQNISTKEITRSDNTKYKAWNTSNVINMRDMFSDAFVFNQKISNWDTSNVTDMSYMFWAANKFNQNISNWDVSNVEYFKDFSTAASSDWKDEHKPKF